MPFFFNYPGTAALAQWVRPFAPQAEIWVFESQPRETQVVRKGTDTSTAERSTVGVNVTGPRR